MKILEAQSATLTNYEVYNHLVTQKARYEASVPRRKGIVKYANLETQYHTSHINYSEVLEI